jgi:hypothetical protein
MPADLEKTLHALAAERARQDAQWARAREALAAFASRHAEPLPVPRAALEELDPLVPAGAATPGLRA